MFTTLLSYDTQALLFARGLIGPEYSRVIQLFGESVVLWCMLLLISLWLGGVGQKKDALKIISLQLFTTIVLVFSFYAIINFGIPKWRPSPQEVAGAIGALIPHPIDNSFPSGHALFSGALLIGLWKYYRRSWILGFTTIIAILTLSARVIGGVHYPGDIIAGLLIGSVGGFFLSGIVTSQYIHDHIYQRIIQLMKWIKL